MNLRKLSDKRLKALMLSESHVMVESMKEIMFKDEYKSYDGLLIALNDEWMARPNKKIESTGQDSFEELYQAIDDYTAWRTNAYRNVMS